MAEPTPADDLAQLLAAVLAYRPQPWAWPRPRPCLPSPSPPPPAPPAGGAAVLEVLAGKGCLTRGGCARVGRTLAPPAPALAGWLPLCPRGPDGIREFSHCYAHCCPCARVGRTHGKHWGLTLWKARKCPKVVGGTPHGSR